MDNMMTDGRTIVAVAVIVLGVGLTILGVSEVIANTMIAGGSAYLLGLLSMPPGMRYPTEQEQARMSSDEPIEEFDCGMGDNCCKNPENCLEQDPED